MRAILTIVLLAGVFHQFQLAVIVEGVSGYDCGFHRRVLLLCPCILGSPRVQRLSSRAIVEAYALRPYPRTAICPFGIVNLTGRVESSSSASPSSVARLDRSSTWRDVELDNDLRTLAPDPWRPSHGRRFALSTLILSAPFFGIPAGGCGLCVLRFGFLSGNTRLPICSPGTEPGGGACLNPVGSLRFRALSFSQPPVSTSQLPSPFSACPIFQSCSPFFGIPAGGDGCAAFRSFADSLFDISRN